MRYKLLFAVLIAFIALAGQAWGWADANYQYRVPVTIDPGGASDLTGFQVEVVVDTATLISAGKMNADCSDVRFYDDDDTTKLNYYLESGCNTNSTTLWVKLSDNGTQIYMYYGNPGAVSESNGSAVFEFYDPGDLSANWTTTGTVTSNGDSIVLNLYDGIRTPLLGQNEAVLLEYKIRNPNGDPSTYRTGQATIKEPSTNAWGYSDASNEVWVMYDDIGQLRKFLASSSVSGTETRIGWDTVQVIWQNGSMGSMSITRLDTGETLSDTFTNIYGAYYSGGWVYGGTQPSFSDGFYWEIYVFVSAGDPTEIDYVIVRKYADPEPSTSLGAEEIAGDMVLEAVEPPDGYVSESQYVNFTAYIEGSNLTRLTLYINDTGQSWSNTTALVNGTNYTFYDRYLPLGNHSWYFELCQNNSGEFCIQSETRNITITGGNVLVFLYDEATFQPAQGNITIKALKADTFELVSNTTAIDGVGSFELPIGDYVIIAGGGQNDSYQYQRRKLISASSGATKQVKMYLPKDNVAQIIFRINDYTGKFGQGTKLSLKRYILDTLTEVDFDYTDIEKKTSHYLLKGAKYYIYVANNGEERALGWFVPDISSVKELIIGEITFTPQTNFIRENIKWDVSSPNNSTVIFSYDDSSSVTTQVDWALYNVSNRSQVIFTSSCSSPTCELTFTGAQEGATYISCFNATTSEFGVVHECTFVTVKRSGERFDLGLSETKQNIISSIILLAISSVFGAVDVKRGVAVFAFAGLILYAAGWLNVPLVIVATVVVYAMIIAIAKKEGESL